MSNSEWADPPVGGNEWADPPVSGGATKPAATTTAPGMAASLARGAAPVAIGAGLGGAVGGPPGAAAGALAVGGSELALMTWNRIAPHLGLPQAITPQEATDKLMDFMGIRRASTGTERMVEAVGGGAVSAGGQALAAGRLATTMAPGLMRSVTERAAEAPGLQTAVGAAQGAGSQGAAEAGAGPTGQAIAGMGTGAVLGLVPGAAKASLKPQVQELLDAGVELTPGQIAGRVPKRAEEAAKSIPITGSFIRGAEGRALDTFNLATANKALEPIGETIPKGTTGRDIIEKGQTILGRAYDDLLSRVSLQSDPQLSSEIDRLRVMADTLPPDRKAQFEGILQRNLLDRMSPAGGLTGGDLKIVMNELGVLAGRGHSSPMMGDQQIADMVDELSNTVDDALRRQNPDQAAQLDKIDRSYAMFVRAEQASSKSAVNDGRYTPGQLLMAIRQQDPTRRKRAFSAGNSLLQDWGQTAYDVMGNRMPDSGTPERQLWDRAILRAGRDAGAVTAGTAYAAFDPVTAAKVAATIGATSLPYTRAGGAAIRGAVQQPTTPLPLMLNPGLMASTPATDAYSALGIQ